MLVKKLVSVNNNRYDTQTQAKNLMNLANKPITQLANQ